MTQSRASRPKPAGGAANPADRAAPVKAAKTVANAAARPVQASTAKPTKPAETAGTTALAAASKPAIAPSHRHPNLGLAPVDMTAGHAAAAEKLRVAVMRISAGALEAAAKADPTVRTRYDEAGLRRLLRDGELLVERLAMCLASDSDRWLAEYAEWIAPIYRRRRVPLGDLSALCAGIRETVEPMLGADEFAAATRSLEVATAVFQRTSRIGGDGHKRNALWKWMYRGV